MTTHTLATSPTWHNAWRGAPAFTFVMLLPSLLLLSMVAASILHTALLTALVAGNIIWIAAITWYRETSMRNRLKSSSSLVEAIRLGDFSIRPIPSHRRSLVHCTERLNATYA